METGAGFVDFAILGDVVVVAGGLRGYTALFKGGCSSVR